MKAFFQTDSFAELCQGTHIVSIFVTRYFADNRGLTLQSLLLALYLCVLPVIVTMHLTFLSIDWEIKAG